MQQKRFIPSIEKVVTLCNEISDERTFHIQAIESARGKKIYDTATEYQTVVPEQQGREAHEKFIQSIKSDILERDYHLKALAMH